MKKLCLLVLAATVFTGIQSAFAFSVDDTSMNSPGKSEQFSDPDDKTPIPSLHLNISGGAAKDNSGTASGVRYDYDPENGTFVPRDPANDKN